jgi:hypothetical protein
MNSRYLALVLVMVILVSVYFDASLYLQTQNQTQPFDPKKTEDFTLYKSEFEVPPTLQQNYSFSTPISMYRALHIALESDGWNKTSLEGMKIEVGLSYIRFINSQNRTGFEVLQDILTQPAGNFSAVQIGDNTYRYVWSIYVANATVNMRPYAYYYVDSASGELVPHGPIF